jgi:predicted house-cleaning NTP pyrophosphatase (Maf/HAM1 superfamily)
VAKNKNLKPQAHVLTVEEASRGGKASATKRLRLKELRECARAVLELDTTINLNGEAIRTSNSTALVLALLKKALDGKAESVAAAKTLISLTGADRTAEESELLRAKIVLTEAKADAIKRGLTDGDEQNKTLDEILRCCKAL